VFVNRPLPLITTAPRYIAVADVLGASVNGSIGILAIASASVAYIALP